MILLMILGYIFVFAFTIVGFLAVFTMLKASNSLFELMLRSIASGMGFFIYFSARVAGVSVPSLLMLSFDNIGGFLGHLALSLIPAIAGSVSTYLLFKNIGKFTEDNDRAVYFMLMFMTLIQFVFLEVFLSGFSDGVRSQHLLINSSFVIGVAGTVLFNIDVLSTLREMVVGQRRPSQTQEQIPESEEKEPWQTKL